MERNRAIREQRRILGGLAQHSPGFNGLFRSTGFRKKIFSFFLPSLCRLRPIDMGMVTGKPQLSAMSCVEASDTFAPDLERADPACTLPRPESNDLAASGMRHRGRTDDNPFHEDEKEEQLRQAIELSEEDIVVRENSDVAHAIMRSKADAPITDDGVIVMRLTKLGNYGEVMAALESSDHLSGPRSRVIEAGCEVRPSWTPALLLVPLTQSQVEEELEMELRAHHIVGCEGDKDLIIAALKTLRCNIRPSVVGPSISSAIANRDERNLTNAADGEVDEIEVEIEYRNTFLDYPIPKDISEVTAFHESAPCGDSSATQPVNPRRYISK